MTVSGPAIRPLTGLNDTEPGLITTTTGVCSQVMPLNTCHQWEQLLCRRVCSQAKTSTDRLSQTVGLQLEDRALCLLQLVTQWPDVLVGWVQVCLQLLHIPGALVVGVWMYIDTVRCNTIMLVVAVGVWMYTHMVQCNTIMLVVVVGVWMYTDTVRCNTIMVVVVVVVVVGVWMYTQSTVQYNHAGGSGGGSLNVHKKDIAIRSCWWW